VAIISWHIFEKMFGPEAPLGDYIPKHLVSSEKIILMTLIRCLGYKKILELGVSEGYTAKFLMGECYGIDKYIGVDVPMGFKTALPIQQVEVRDVSGSVALGDNCFRMLILQNGTQGLVDNMSILGESDFDVCFVDADHSYEGIKRDTAIARKVVRRGGVIVWHDYNNRLLQPNCVNQFIDQQNIGGGDHIFLVEGDCYLFLIQGK
jgi:hypothetical protein